MHAKGPCPNCHEVTDRTAVSCRYNASREPKVLAVYLKRLEWVCDWFLERKQISNCNHSEREEGAFLKLLSLILFAILVFGVSVSTVIGQQTGDQLTLEQYSWPLNEPLVGVFINNGSTPIDLGAAHFYFFPNFTVRLTGTCSGATLIPQQSCDFTIALPSSIVGGKLSISTTSAVLFTYTSTFTYGWTTGESYSLMLTIAGFSHYFGVAYGGASNQPEQWVAISPGQIPMIMVTNGVTSNGVYPPTTSASQTGALWDFFVHHAFGLGAVALGTVIIGVILSKRRHRDKTADGSTKKKKSATQKKNGATPP
jgi:hypothetical protein